MKKYKMPKSLGQCADLHEELDVKRKKLRTGTPAGYKHMTPREVNTLLMDMMGIPRAAQDDYRAVNKLA